MAHKRINDSPSDDNSLTEGFLYAQIKKNTAYSSRNNSVPCVVHAFILCFCIPAWRKQARGGKVYTEQCLFWLKGKAAPASQGRSRSLAPPPERACPTTEKKGLWNLDMLARGIRRKTARHKTSASCAYFCMTA